MSLNLKNHISKKIAISFILLFVWDIAFPTFAYALTGGPTQPEFTSFEPVATTSMVNEFTGDLTYNLPVINIPGAEGGGYALSLSYHSGTGVEGESSWVGHGWTLNPGAITRNKRGFADDWNGKEVKFYNKTRPNRTVTLGGSLGDFEAYSVDLSFNGSASIRYNNYKGFGYTLGLGVATTDGVFSLGYQLSDGEGSFSAQVSPGALLNKNKDDSEEEQEENDLVVKEEQIDESTSVAEEFNSTADVQKEKIAEYQGSGSLLRALGSSAFGIMSLANSPSPQYSTPFNGSSFRLNVTFQIDPSPIEMSPLSGNLFGSYSSQKNEEVRSQNAYGYMYSKQAWSDLNKVMDYGVERPSGYSRHDKVLPVPYSSNDIYSLSGEGLGGGFRMHNKKIGHYSPSYSLSHTAFISGGLDLDVGLASGAGADGSSGDQYLTISHWNGTPHLTDFSDVTDDQTDEASFFRFTNDLGGSVIYGESTNWNKASSGFPSEEQITIGSERSARSSYIGFNTNENIQKYTGASLSSNSSPNGVRPFAYTKREDIHNQANRSQISTEDQIGEFSVINESGSRYTYGLPVYTRKEENVQVNLSDNLQASDFENNFLLYQNVPSNGDQINVEALDAVVGQYAASPYAASYLLTSITTADYIDRTQDGPTPDDFGGYTKFNYKKIHGSNSESGDWYKFRTPYAGLNYSRNSFSDPKDDLAGYASGEKEIYYLESIETKTHIARFITSDRYDGIEAEERGPASSNQLSMSNNLRLKKLDKIILFEKDSNGDDGKELQTTFFQYNNSIQTGGGLPNFDNYDGNANSYGKLTLKKVWMEYNDIYKAKIAPYIFQYEYPNFSLNYGDQGYQYLKHADYENIGENDGYAQFEDHLASGLAENTTYNPLTVDAWGNYQPNPNRYSNYEKWNDQSNDAVPNEDFDPAMWQLKKIILPSGGQIHIQYEQDDYAFVQHEVAHTLVSLDLNANTKGDASYTLNLDDVGITDTDDIQKYANQIKDLYVGTGRKMYFKFFYKLLGFDQPQLDDCDSDFIKGYMDVLSVFVNSSNKIEIIPKGEILPKKLCHDFVKTQRAGMINNSSCNPADPEFFDGSDAEEFIRNLIGFSYSFAPGSTCVNRNNEFSYLRIPVFRGIRTLANNTQRIQGKRGGGLRVKRLLMYDQESTHGLGRVLYGSEYYYITKDYEGNYISSGVATNEPYPNREENPMVTMMERFKQSFLNRMIAGKDKKQMEGPIGENILPGPTVGYSNVIVKGIHSGRTHLGYTEKQFYTAYDCPFYYSDNNADPIEKKWAINKGSDMVTEVNNHGTTFPISLPTGLINFSDYRVKARQGFNFALNNMHGQVKSSSTYSNVYKLDESDLKNSLGQIDIENVLIANEVHEYFGPNELIPTVSKPNGPISMEPMGIENEIAFESKHIKDMTTSVSLEGDGGVSFFGIITFPFIAMSPSFTSVNNEIYTHVTTKVTNYPAITKKVSNYQDGICHVTENLAFDKYSGKAVVTRTFDDFDGDGLPPLQGINHDASITAHNFTAPMVYANMGQKAEHENLIVPHTDTYMIDRISPTILQIVPDNTTLSEALCDASDALPLGSLIQLSTGMNGTEQDFYHIDYIEDGLIHLQEVSFSDYTGGMVQDISLRIIRSGKTNQLSSSAGSIAFYGDANMGSNQPSASQLNDMNSLVAVLNNNWNGQGLISGTTIENLTSNLDLFVDGECQSFPGDEYSIDLSDGQLKIIKPVPVDGPLNMECNQIRPYILSQLNAYWSEFLKPISAPNFLEPSECQNFSFSNYYLEEISGAPSEIIQSAVDIFNQPIHPDLAGSNCDDKINKYFEPVHRTNHPVIKKVQNGETTFYNAEIVIRDIYEDKYYVAFARCTDDNRKLKIYYGVCDGSEINNNYLDTDESVLQNVTFNMQADIGSFIPGVLKCMQYEYPIAGSTQKGYSTLEKVETIGELCDPENSDHKVICANSLGKHDQGKFALDNSDGNYNLIFYPYGEACNNTFIQVSCLSFCDFSQNVLKDVLNSSYLTYSDAWPFETELYAENSSELNNYGSQNDFEIGARGKWRPQSSYSYLNERGLLTSYEASNAEEKNYNTGVYDMLLFDWENPDNYNQYKETSNITMYSPHGQVLEEQNIIDVKSAAKFGYNHMLPYLVAQNSDYHSCLFESFEKVYSNEFLEDGLYIDPLAGEVDNSEAHSGNASFKLIPSKKGFKIHTVKNKSEILKQGGIVKLWVKSDRKDRENIENDLRLTSSFKGNSGYSNGFKKVARSGDWALYEALIPEATLAETEFYINYIFRFPYESIHIDDLRIQPKHSQMASYVYDPLSFKLVASFDDQNFGLFYQYNEEGQLVRQLKETTRGIKTIQESQYNTHEYAISPWENQ
ncbi:MAG: hypothetical protein AAF487_11220 [Bacteroidota bacterium]